MARFVDETPKEQPWNQLHMGFVDGNTVERMWWEQKKKRETESKL
jgi:hypothetical protein